MKTLQELLEQISNGYDVSFPLILRKGHSSSSKWNFTRTDNTIDCDGLTHWPGGANVLSCCHRLNPSLHGVNSASLEILNRECGEYPSSDYQVTNIDGNYDCCANTTYKGIPMNLSKRQIYELYENEYPHKNILLTLLENEPEFFELSSLDELMNLIRNYNIYDDETETYTNEIKNWFVFE